MRNNQKSFPTYEYMYTYIFTNLAERRIYNNSYNTIRKIHTFFPFKMKKIIKVIQIIL